MEYNTSGNIPAVFKNSQVLVTVAGNEIDLMAIESMDDMRVILANISLEAVTRSLAEAMAPKPKTEVPMPGPDEAGGYAEQIRQSFQDQATKAQERLNDLAKLHENTNE